MHWNGKFCFNLRKSTKNIINFYESGQWDYSCEHPTLGSFDVFMCIHGRRDNVKTLITSNFLTLACWSNLYIDNICFYLILGSYFQIWRPLRDYTRGMCANCVMGPQNHCLLQCSWSCFYYLKCILNFEE